ncbi:DNA polymerase III subunit alpha [Streptomyces sp. SL13]|uniref:DNA polymerase III subunit alpha n=1 Tax=Streptantibioticus silvisoli TaxID=2705255 RepID=A0AA90JYY6_9ACTN|nr:DNA polymerase III subunit alpha [Streptantibioticus silvisoli]MDI5971651.1 DNA polymerase III subunit alpha [Streptantibioticus silvisoli]
MGFTHLHTVSGFSMRYGASHPQALAERAAERGMDALALTDRDGVAGAVRFAEACARAGVRPVFGAGIAVPAAEPTDGGARRRTPVRGGAFVDESAPRAVFLARDGAAGWAELCALLTAAHRGGTPVRPEWADLTGAGLTVLLGPDSEVGRELAAGRPDRAERRLAPWRERYGDALRLEVVCHGRTGTGPGSVRQAARTLGFAVERGIRAVLTNAVRYADPGQREVADVLDAARLLVPVDTRRPERLDSGEAWLKDAGTMARIAERVAEAAGFRRDTGHRLLRMTEETAAACAVDPEEDIGTHRVHFPEPELVGAGRRGADRVLRSRCTAAMITGRYDLGADRRDRWHRLEDELRVIGRLGLAGYFLTVARVVDDTRDLGIRVAARGSGASSFVNHLLGVAAADPMEHGLLMERFLSPDRVAMPDIDIDVESARRIEVYRAILDRFGPERVATVAMPETYRVRHAIRDVGAALGMDPQDVDRLAKAFPHIRARDARAALAELPELRAVDAQGYADRYGGRLWDLVEALDGLPRGIAMHPCGVLLSDARLLSRTPVMPTSGEGLPMAQFDKDDVEVLGLLKLDVLGVRMQSAMAHAVQEIARAGGERLDLDRLPADDPETYRLIRSAETLGCFQIESPGQRDLVGRMQPSTFHDIVVDISLFRPGPVAADMVRPFIEARHGRARPEYPHPALAEVLGDTYGVVVFHEQVIRMLHVLTGCSLAEADEKRRALSDPERQGRVRAWFAAAARERGSTTEQVRRTWQILEAFGSYGFCKAHAVAFAVPTYQSAWLKAHRPAAFYAGLLTHDPGMYPKRLLLADARRRGVPVLPLDVNASGADYQIELVCDEPRPGDESRPGVEPGSDVEPGSGIEPRPGVWGLRLALSDVHGISEEETARLVAGRPYTSPRDLWQRARPSRPVLERLVRVGALDSFLAGSTANRRDLLLQVAELQRGRDAAARAGQLALPDAEPGAPVAAAGLPDLDDRDRTQAELGILGMDASRHVMDERHAFLRELGATPARRLREARHGETVLVAGAKAATQTPPIRSGRRVIFLTLDDGTGLVDLAFFDDSHEACAHTVFHSWLLLVRGVVQRRGPRSLTVVGQAAWNLADLAELRRTGGLEAVATTLAAPPPAAPRAPGTDADGAARPAPDPARPPGRSIHLPTGYELHPWADLQPPGEQAATGRKLWHSSQGSAG